MSETECSWCGRLARFPMIRRGVPFHAPCLVEYVEHSTVRRWEERAYYNLGASMDNPEYKEPLWLQVSIEAPFPQ